MAKDRRKLQHIHSSIPDRQPTPQTLEVGEIAVNNAAEKEFISLKNTDNKVVRISSDKQMITWMEKKEVMPYSGTVDNVHLDTNRSNIEIKLNQVAAKNTAKYNVVNGAKDIDGNDVNPSSDGGLTNGAGFAIDMSRYAMIGANPSFSSITVTHQSNLSGTTNISNGAGGNSLNITTTNVNVTGTNWTEAIGTKIENISGRTTTIGTSNESLHVIGITTETHDGNVTINNKANVIETTTGNTTFNTSGDTTIKSVGVTLIDSTRSTTIQATDTTNGDVNIYAKDALTETGKTVSITGTDSATIKAATTTISGATTNVTGATTLNLSGGTINTNANTANTNAASAYTNISTATTVIGTANATASTASLSGKTLTIDEKESISAKTPSLSVSATTINVTGDTTFEDNVTIKKDLVLLKGIKNPLSWEYGSVASSVGSSYNGTEDKTITIPKTISDVASGKVSSDASGNLSVGGTITATGAIYSSDINLKENVQNVDYPTYANANGVAIRKFNFKNDESKRTVYGVIAQEVEIAGLEDIVVVKEDGFKGVDYTALSLLKIAYLENKVKELEAMIKKLTEEK